MSLNIESLFIVLAFVMPGFLTSRLVDARTPSIAKQSSPFVETTESILRSFYINIIAGPVVLLFFLLLVVNQTDLTIINQEGVYAFTSHRPFQSMIFLLTWLALAIVLAFIFGYIWDPFQYFSDRLIEVVGFKTRDPWFELRQFVKEKRDQGETNCQLWLQVRLKNGSIYQGEFVHIGSRDKELSRELLLANVDYHKKPDGNPQESPEQFDHVFLDMENVISIDVLIGTFTP